MAKRTRIPSSDEEATPKDGQAGQRGRSPCVSASSRSDSSERRTKKTKKKTVKHSKEKDTKKDKEMKDKRDKKDKEEMKAKKDKKAKIQSDGKAAKQSNDKSVTKDVKKHDHKRKERDKAHDDEKKKKAKSSDKNEQMFQDIVFPADVNVFKKPSMPFGLELDGGLVVDIADKGAEAAIAAGVKIGWRVVSVDGRMVPQDEVGVAAARLRDAEEGKAKVHVRFIEDRKEPPRPKKPSSLVFAK
eukprot:TRINITY_DN14366_c0_g1_i1.p1 TRINITY_DN14366_c0_g1~~TRINITY_DN14366_c0_g1_i1.p1  ORF type:complete len:243 (-),score=60.37 TRINITY_DN14366_c0_g1_i1:46-774(-)